MGTAIAPDGSTFVASCGTSDSEQRRWIVRKRACPQSCTTNQHVVVVGQRSRRLLYDKPSIESSCGEARLISNLALLTPGIPWSQIPQSAELQNPIRA